MAALSNTEAAALLNASLRSGAVYLALFLTDPTAAGTGTEASGGGYARKAVSFSAPAPAVGRQQVENSAAVEFPAFTADIGTVAYWGVYDAPSGGNLKWFAPFDRSKVIEADDNISIKAGGLTIWLA